jgi:hypothetical protein
MVNDQLLVFRVDAALMAGLRRVKERDGIPVTEQTRRALTDWLRKRTGEPMTNFECRRTRTGASTVQRRKGAR